jgi:serine/threonine protein kinase
LVNIRLSQGSWEYDPANKLGRDGHFGAVYFGRGKNDLPVAIKKLHVGQTENASREVQVAKSLLGHTHPHVIGLLDIGVDSSSGAIFLVMEKAEQSLQDLIDKRAPLPPTDALEIIDAIAAGLEEIGNLVHRDLKPDNVLLHNGVWKLADLGLARFVEAITASNTMKGYGTLPYCAPEQIRGDRATKKTDVYALGAILYALLTGQPPFPGPTREDYIQQHLYETAGELKNSTLIIPAIQQLGYDCLAKNPLNRPELASLRNRVQYIRISLGVTLGLPRFLGQ